MTWPLALMIELTDAAVDDFSSTFSRIRYADPALPLHDRAIQHGDGVFETLLVVDAHAQDVTAHLERFAQSARLADLPLPNEQQWRAAIAYAEAQCPAGISVMKLTLSRGTDAATAWLTAASAPDHTAVRERGVRVVTLDRGYDIAAAERAPWLLLGAKTLSYAVNMAALREAQRRGADEAVFVTSDEWVLEAPTASVIIRQDGTFRTPAPAGGVLQGTTQLGVFDFLRERGFLCEYAQIHASDLLTADAAWLVSSVRLAVPVTEVDGLPIPVDAALTAQLNVQLLAPRG